MNLLKDLLKIDISHLQDICNNWELTESELKWGSDGEKFHDGLDSIDKAIFNKVDTLLQRADVDLEISDVHNFVAVVEDVNTSVDLDVKSLLDLLLLIEKYK